MGSLGSPFPRPSLSYCERDRSDEPVRIFYSAEPSVGSKGAIGCSNILSFGKPLEGLKAGNRRSNNRTIYVRMRLTIYLFIYLFNPNEQSAILYFLYDRFSLHSVFDSVYIEYPSWISLWSSERKINNSCISENR